MSDFALWFRYDVRMSRQPDYIKQQEALERVRVNAARIISGQYCADDTGLVFPTMFYTQTN